MFTQTTWDQEGYAIRDPGSTTYTGAIESAEDFGKRIYLEAWNRAKKKVVMGDGAEWIWNLADLHFPGAVQIVDLYHARQHLWDLARRLHPNDPVAQKAWMKGHQKRLLDKGKIENWCLRYDPSNPIVLNFWKRFAPRLITLNETPSVCATPRSAINICSPAPV